MRSTTLISRASMALAVLVASACASRKSDFPSESASANPGIVAGESVARDSAYGFKLMPVAALSQLERRLTTAPQIQPQRTQVAMVSTHLRHPWDVTDY